MPLWWALKVGPPIPSKRALKPIQHRAPSSSWRHERGRRRDTNDRDRTARSMARHTHRRGRWRWRWRGSCVGLQRGTGRGWWPWLCLHAGAGAEVPPPLPTIQHAPPRDRSPESGDGDPIRGGACARKSSNQGNQPGQSPVATVATHLQLLASSPRREVGSSVVIILSSVVSPIRWLGPRFGLLLLLLLFER